MTAVVLLAKVREPTSPAALIMIPQIPSRLISSPVTVRILRRIGILKGSADSTTHDPNRFNRVRGGCRMGVAAWIVLGRRRSEVSLVTSSPTIFTGGARGATRPIGLEL